MNKALNALEEISNDPESKELAEMREKARINLHILTSEAEAAGEARGEANGEAKGKADAILKMANKGFAANEIAQIFDITIEEVQSILNSR
jgi:predicted transposase/invertase (TIGR01784 family)